MSILSEIKQSFKLGSSLTKLIYINIGVFVIVKLISVVFWISGTANETPLFTWLAAPAYLPTLLYKPWTVITYMFYHEDFLHILFNLLGLYWFGRIFLQFLGERQLIGTYVLGAVSGYILFLLSYYTIPPLQLQLQKSLLLGYPVSILGASAGVIATLAAVSFYRPNYTIFLMFVGQIKLKYLALTYIALDILMMAGGNAGGHISHLGGALFGFLFATQYLKGKDLTKGINRVIDFLVTLLRPRKKMKISHKRTVVNEYEYNKVRADQQKDLDVILDKISKSGYESLSKEEKEKLFRMSGK